MTGTVRYPLQPLVDYLTATGAHDEHHWFIPDHSSGERYLSFRRVGYLCDVSMQTIQRYSTDGLSEQAADRIATHLGLHVSMLWGEHYNHEIDVIETVPYWNRKAARHALSRGEPIEHLYSTLPRRTPGVPQRSPLLAEMSLHQ